MTQTSNASDLNLIPVSTGQIIPTLCELLLNYIVTMLWGGPGIGKSDAVRACAQHIAANMGLIVAHGCNAPDDTQFGVIDFRASQHDSVDLTGLPDKQGDMMSFLRPEFLPLCGRGILLLDEVNSAPRAMQAALYQLALDRQCGSHLLPDGWSVVMAGNRESDGGVTERMPAPLANRAVHLEIVPTVDDWAIWALANGVRAEVVAFARWKQLVYQYDKNSPAFLTPRSLAKASRLLDILPDSEMRHVALAGTIGRGHAVELSAYLRLIDKLPKIKDIIAHPSTAELPSDGGVTYAVATALGKVADRTNLRAIITYMERIGSPEFLVMSMRDALQRDSSLGCTREVAQYAAKYGQLIV